MRLVFFGPPGAGKGTQSKLLVRRFGLDQISTGDLFRHALKEGSSVGLEARRYMDGGKLVPDDVVNLIVEEALDDIGGDGFILDGFPRTLPQASWLLEYLGHYEPPLNAVISLQVDEEVIVRRLSQRRMDVKTGAIYHLDYNPPPPDLPEDRLVHRSDDDPEAIRTRLRVYAAQTSPIESFLAERVKVLTIDGYGEIDDVHNRIVAALHTAGVTQPA
jgi:adenylate kinase